MSEKCSSPEAGVSTATHAERTDLTYRCWLLRDAVRGTEAQQGSTVQCSLTRPAVLWQCWRAELPIPLWDQPRAVAQANGWLLAFPLALKEEWVKIQSRKISFQQLLRNEGGRGRVNPLRCRGCSMQVTAQRHPASFRVRFEPEQAHTTASCSSTRLLCMPMNINPSGR